MIIAVTGVSGLIGSSVSKALASAGHQVVGLVRAQSRREHIRPSISRFVVGDQSDPSIWPDLLSDAEALVHNSFDWGALQSENPADHLRSNLEGSVMLLQKAREMGIRRFVYVSSVATMHHISDRWNGRIDEDHPLRPGSVYGACKAAVEAHLWAEQARGDIETVSIRPAGVYGVEPVRLDQSLAYAMVRQLIEGGSIGPDEFRGGGKFIHVDDVADAILRACEAPGASGHAFNLADCYTKWTRFGQFAAESLGLDPARVVPDEGPPAKNMFDKTAVREFLGLALDRGEAGIRAYVVQLIEAIQSELAAGSGANDVANRVYR